MAYEPFEPAFPLPINFSIVKNTYENSKEKYPKRLQLFVPLDSIDQFVRHIQILKNDSAKIKKGKVYDMATNERMEVDGIYLNGNGRQNMFHPEDEDLIFGIINPKRLEDIELPTNEEQEKSDTNMNWDSEEIPF